MSSSSNKILAILLSAFLMAGMASASHSSTISNFEATFDQQNDDVRFSFDADSGLGDAQVEIEDSSGSIAKTVNLTESETGTYDTTTTLSDGTFTGYLLNESDGTRTGDSVSVTVDTTAPTVDSFTLSDDYVQSGTAIDVDVEASDENSIQSVSVNGNSASLNSGVYETTITTESTEGTYDATVTVTDNYGNENTQTVQYTVDDTAPEIFEYSVTNLDGDSNSLAMDGDTIEHFVDTENSNIQSVVVDGNTMTGGSDGEYTTQTTWNSDTSYQYTVEVTDDAGNTNTESVTVEKNTVPNILNPHLDVDFENDELNFTIEVDDNEGIESVSGMTQVGSNNGNPIYAVETDDVANFNVDSFGIGDSKELPTIDTTVTDTYGSTKSFTLDMFVESSWGTATGSTDEQTVGVDHTFTNQNGGDPSVRVIEPIPVDSEGYEVISHPSDDEKDTAISSGNSHTFNFQWTVDMLSTSTANIVPSDNFEQTVDNQKIEQEKTIDVVDADGNSVSPSVQFDSITVDPASGLAEIISDLTSEDVSFQSSDTVIFSGQGDWVKKETKVVTEQDMDKTSTEKEQYFVDIEKVKLNLTESSISEEINVSVSSTCDETDTIITGSGFAICSETEKTKDIVDTSITELLSSESFQHTIEEQEVYKNKTLTNTGEYDLDDLVLIAPDFLSNSYSNQTIDLNSGENYTKRYNVAGNFLEVNGSEVENTVSASFENVSVPSTSDYSLPEYISVPSGEEVNTAASGLLDFGDNNMTGEFTEGRSGILVAIGSMIILALGGLGLRRVL